jgi:hypothetical protein
MGKTPFFKNGSRHSGHSASRFRRAAPLGTAEQPRFECFRRWILLDHALEQIPLDCQADGIRRLVALTASPASLGRFERGEQSRANLCRPNYCVAHVLQNRRLLLPLGLGTMLISGA